MQDWARRVLSYPPILGIIGAFVGAYLGQVFGIYEVGEPAGFIGSVVGAVIVLGLSKRLRDESSIAKI